MATSKKKAEVLQEQEAPVVEKSVPVEDTDGKPQSQESVFIEPAVSPGIFGEDTSDAPVEAGTKSFRVTCRNKISGTIGGVEFVDGVGYTSDGFSASWFANKDGYSVDPGKEKAGI
ncbi:MAG: hypothetical protein NC305_13330 [Lachnospiraceae bacterium]|nr:hypothetical protein [Butyrivibrio sp.]MCM1344020.1 hypothetical protein [Muribaculaceae bacterium]MCM1411513.1 hypothetical protein [Lachnospiraceae bacterium]